MLVLNRSDLSRQSLTTWPNVLTYFRMATIPLIVALLAPTESGFARNLAFAIYCIASITDYLDGHLARRSNTVTSIGKLLDPLADKLLTTAVLIMLIPKVHAVYAWLVFLIVGREIGITGLRSIAAGHGLIINPSRMGKNKMVSQTLALLFLLPAVPEIQSILTVTGICFLWISLVLGYVSAIDYFVSFYREAKRQGQPAR
ncbi:MAG: CDP-diacylglycerol--glycerol-3-phosphate 3-phosphatidyltransferase [Deltaproteobacteria bacterium]|jgi:CDP-diacylglycerol--glycerol-3-phosphate 3-phosphatidyltransferase|nr:CDP-diacylglycerol--glycerol-3-phosphate 3-phosphatidyltransferase [Deltaproteobacteria bacterium]MDA8307803.1 CDP-diacylglycerol--glycerol-3-phosphate 3-phosphatidyltransferase [Deltaproteobacteria bacterium]